MSRAFNIYLPGSFEIYHIYIYDKKYTSERRCIVQAKNTNILRIIRSYTSITFDDYVNNDQFPINKYDFLHKEYTVLHF